MCYVCICNTYAPDRAREPSARKVRIMTNTPNTPQIASDDYGPYAGDVDAYRASAGDRSAMGKIRTKVRNASTDAIRAMDIVRANQANNALDAMTTRTDANPVDWPQLVANRIATYHAAANRVVANLPDDVRATVESFVADNADLDDIEDLASIGVVDDKLADSLATRSIGRKTFTGDRGDVDAHIGQVIAKLGRFAKVAEIARTRSDAYGDRRPSAGAVGAALGAMIDPDNSREVPDDGGFRPEKDADGHLGAGPA